MVKVVIEGPDGSGKSNLVARLLASTNLEVKPRACTSENGAIENLGGWVRDYLDSIDSGIYDRHPLISDFIYGPIIRGGVHPDFTGMLSLEEYFEGFYSHDLVLVYCLPPWFTVHENILKNHEPTTDHLKGVIDNARALYDLYMVRYIMDLGRHARTWLWDYSGFHPENTLRGILKDIHDLSEEYSGR